jgi:hypothetical protein
VPFLQDVKAQGDVAIEDLEERFYVSYEMAAHRFANLATHHLDIPVHFVRSDEEGVIWKAYGNDDIPFPTDPDGATEGQPLCRYWAARQIFRSEQMFSTYYQRTETEHGQYWSSTYLDAARGSHHAITVGTQLRYSRHFRGPRHLTRHRRGVPTALAAGVHFRSHCSVEWQCMALAPSTQPHPCPRCPLEASRDWRCGTSMSSWMPDARRTDRQVLLHSLEINTLLEIRSDVRVSATPRSGRARESVVQRATHRHRTADPVAG